MADTSVGVYLEHDGDGHISASLSGAWAEGNPIPRIRIQRPNPDPGGAAKKHALLYATQYGFAFEMSGQLTLACNSLSVWGPVTIQSYTVATLPSAAGYPGARATATDLSGSSYVFGAEAAGGGSRIGPVFSDGAVWREG